MEDIKNIDDIKVLVDTFYKDVLKDNLLGSIFNREIKDWEIHLEKMYRFWNSILFGGNTYTGKPFDPHIRLKIGEEHFTHWIKAFEETVDNLFIGEKTEEIKKRARQIAQVFQFKLEKLDRK